MDEEDYDDEPHYIYKAIEIPFIDKEELPTFTIGVSAITIGFVLLNCYIHLKSSISKDVLKYLAYQHIVVGFFHITFLTFYNLHLIDNWFLNSCISLLFSVLDLDITICTGSISWIVFLRLFLLRNGDNLYSVREIAMLPIVIISLINLCENLVSYFFDVSKLALRLMLILLLMSSPLILCFRILKTLLTPSSIVPKREGLFCFCYLLIFSISDCILLRYNLENTADISLRFVWIYLLIGRLFVEMLWFVICDIFFIKFFC